MQVPKEIESDPRAAIAFRVFLEHWELPFDKQLAISAAAAKLRDLIINNDTDAEGWIYSTIEALHHFARSDPGAIDWGIDIFRNTAAQLPQTLQHPYGKGPIGAEGILKWYLVEFATFFEGNVPSQYLGTVQYDVNKSGALVDESNIIFTHSEIQDSQPAVLQKFEDWQKDRLDIIVMMTLLGRCHSKGYAHLNRGGYTGDHIVVSIDNALDRQRSGTPLWAKADFIACCILLRSCAKSLIDVLPEDRKVPVVAHWKEALASFLHSDKGGNNTDDDFDVKIHASRALANLTYGPYDEDSSRLFRLADWVF